MKIAKAFSPAGITSFFEICDTPEKGNPISDLTRVGARGGGFVIKKGTTTTVSISEAKINSIYVSINKEPAPEAETTKTVAEMLLEKTEREYAVRIDHKIEIPIGAGFGSSAAGALSAALALSKVLDLDLTYNQLGKIAHVAEVSCRTGLGTVGPLMLGGCILTVEPGGPGIGVIDRIPITPDYVIVAGVFGPMPTKQVISSPEKRREVNRWGNKTLEKILAEPSLENFLSCCRDFAEKTGFMTEGTKNLARLAQKAGAIGATQNMVGEAIHAITTSEKAGRIVQAFKQVLPSQKILVSEIDLQGARLIT